MAISNCCSAESINERCTDCKENCSELCDTCGTPLKMYEVSGSEEHGCKNGCIS